MAATPVRAYFSTPDGEGFGSVSLQVLDPIINGEREGVWVAEAIRTLEAAQARVLAERAAIADRYVSTHPDVADDLVFAAQQARVSEEEILTALQKLPPRSEFEE